MFLRKAVAFIKRDFLTEISYKSAFLMNIIGIFFSVLTFFFIAKLFGKAAAPYLQEYGGNYFPFVLIGIAFSTFLGVGLGTSAAAIRQEQMWGTLEAMLITPTRASAITLYLSLWNFIFSSFNILIYLLIGRFVFGLKFSVSQPLLILLILFLSILSFSSLGIISSSFVMIFKRGDPVNWIVSSSFELLGGIYYPITILPEPLKIISHLLPITYSLKALRGVLLADYSFTRVKTEILALCAFAIILFPLAILFFEYALKWAKRDGSLCQY
ncbi:MAG: ABC transporter permease [Candidatus Aminicenantia bacterium]